MLMHFYTTQGMYELALIPIGVIVLYFEDTELFDMGMNLLHRISKHKYSDGQGKNTTQPGGS